MTARASSQRLGTPKNDEYYTPKHIFDALGLLFDVDVASPEHGITNVPAIQKITPSQDGLITQWNGLVWMNPPFSKCKPWVEKWLAHGNGLALLQTSSAKWFQEIWEKADGILMLGGHLKFDRPDGGRKDVFMPVALFAMGDVSYQALLNSNLGRVR